MPIMPRVDKKAAEIAYNIIGKPSNLINPKAKEVKPTIIKSGGYSELERSTPVRIPVR